MSPGQRDVLESLEAYAERHGEDGLPWETALDQLEANDLERVAARGRIEGLLLKGYLYEVDEELRIPPRL